MDVNGDRKLIAELEQAKTRAINHIYNHQELLEAQLNRDDLPPEMRACILFCFGCLAEHGMYRGDS